ncbi:MAG: hypothetical protein OXR66_02450 [Candidatus Woesearchaeota archaeon]|nr:hypothetical protein [Candidatus Woesearchaeota archaeon]
MTGIQTVPKWRQQPKDLGAVVCMADSMWSTTGTTPEEAAKFNTLPKLFDLGGRKLLLGTGGENNAIGAVASELEAHAEHPVEQLAEATFQIVSKKMQIPEEERPQFLLTGPDAEGVIVTYQVHAAPYSTFDPVEKMQVTRVATRCEYPAFLGIGAKRANEYLEAQRTSGRHNFLKTLTDAIITGYGAFNKAAENLHVDDRMQLGIVQPEGTTILYPGCTNVGGRQQWASYLQKITGRDIFDGDAVAGKDGFNETYKHRDASEIIGGFYDTLMAQLDVAFSAMNDHATVTEMQFYGDATLQDVAHARRIRSSARQQLNEGVTTLLSKDIKQMGDYHARHAANLADRAATLGK